MPMKAPMKEIKTAVLSLLPETAVQARKKIEKS